MLKLAKRAWEFQQIFVGRGTTCGSGWVQLNFVHVVSARQYAEAQRTWSSYVMVNRLLRGDHSSGITNRFSSVQVASVGRKHLARDHHT
jgi:hypothetical protein